MSNNAQARDHPTESDPNHAILVQVIHRSDWSRLRMILMDVCQKIPQAYDIACDRLLFDPDDISETSSLDDDYEHKEDTDDEGENKDEENANDGNEGGTELPTDPKNKKRKALTFRYELSKQCDEEYDVEHNYEESCMWHPGVTYPVSETDRNSDQILTVPPDDLETIRQVKEWLAKEDEYYRALHRSRRSVPVPETLVYACCERGEGKEGCMMGEHRPFKRKKLKYADGAEVHRMLVRTSGDDESNSDETD